MNKLIPLEVRDKNGWYEEDCDWSIPCAVLYHYIERDKNPHCEKIFSYDTAFSCLKRWRPEFYNKFFKFKE